MIESLDGGITFVLRGDTDNPAYEATKQVDATHRLKADFGVELVQKLDGITAI